MTYGSNTENWKRFDEITNKIQSPQLFIPSVGPGYIDTNIRQWNGKNTKDRMNGQYYKDFLNSVIGEKVPEFLSITSFNEWHEGTQIEPAIKKERYLDYGSDSEIYLKMTKEVYILQLYFYSLLKTTIITNFFKFFIILKRIYF